MRSLIFTLFLMMALSFSTKVWAQCQAGFTTVGTGPTISFTNTSTSSSAGTMYYWTFGDGSSSAVTNPVHIYNANGVYVVCLMVIDSAANCTSTYCDSVQVTNAPNNCLAFCSVQTQACQAFFSASGSTITPGDSILTYNWNSAAGNFTTTTPYTNFSFSGNGVYPVVLTITTLNGCTSSYTINVTINNCNSTLCVDSSLINLNALCPLIWAPVCGCNGVTYANSCEATNYGGVTSYTNGPCATSGCQASFQSLVNGLTVDFTNTSSVFNPNATTYTWDFGDGSTGSGQFPSHTYAAIGNYTVCLYIADTLGCADTICNVISLINVVPTCGASFTYTFNSNGCTLNFDASASSAVAPATVIAYMWDFGDGNSAMTTSPTYTYSYAANGTYQVVLIITTSDSCNSYFISTVTVSNCQSSSNCNACFTSASQGCNAFFNASCSNGGGSTIGQYFWDFGDGTNTTSSSNVANHTYSANGIYMVRLVISSPNTPNSCIDSVVLPVTITNCGANPSCNAVITGSNSNNPCEGVFDASASTSNGNILSYIWTYGDGSNPSSTTTPTSSHIYTANGTYSVCVGIVTSNGCTDTACFNVNITNCLSALNSTNLQNNVSLSPNPVINNLNINFNALNHQQVTVGVYNVTGIKVSEKAFHVKEGQNQLVIDASNFATGVYYIKLEQNGAQAIKKFVKK